MMRTIHLHGYLAEEFGGPYDLAVQSTAEAVRALSANFKTFAGRIRDGEFHVFRGDPSMADDLGEGDLMMRLGRERDLHIVPVVAGAGGGGGRSKGIAKIILGIALIGAAIAIPAIGGAASIGAGFGTSTGLTIFGEAITYGSLAKAGLFLAIGGAAAMLSSTPKVKDSNYSAREQPDQRASFIFNGPVNTVEQGGPVPVAYGRIRVGSKVVSGGIETQQIGDTDPTEGL